MKKKLCVLLALICLLAIPGCGTNHKVEKEVLPELSQMQAICELATMKCYYHNVAKYYEEDASGILWWEKDRNFWVEYAGIVTVGIDTSKVKLKVTGNKVTITMPKARVLDCKVDEATLTADSFIVASDSADVKAEHQTAALAEAQANMEQAASLDNELLANAEQRAQKLLSDYVKNIGDSFGKEYVIEWVSVD